MPERVPSSTSQLKPAQQRALLALESEPGASLTRSKYERLTGAGRSQAAYDLSELVSAGLLVRVGGGRSTRYVLAHEPAPQRRWTPDRIRRELDLFCAGRNVWPTPGEFKAAGRGDLYVAARRYGGVPYWANELGLERGDRLRADAKRARVPLRIRLAWGLTGAVATGALAAAAVTAVVATHNLGSGGENAKASLGTRSAPWIVLHLARPPHPASSGSRQKAQPVRRHVTRSKPVQKMSPVSERLPAGSELDATTASGQTPAASAAQSGGAAPLPAPTGAAAPSPLRAP